MDEYIVIKSFKMDYRRKRNQKDYSDGITVKEGQILELVDGIDLLFRIKDTKIGLRLDPWTIHNCLEEKIELKVNEDKPSIKLKQ